MGEGRYAVTAVGGEGRSSDGEGENESEIVKTVHIQVHDGVV